MSMDNVVATAPYRSRCVVHHEDGPDQEFWDASYFIPGISGRARCLTTTQDPPLLSLRSNDTIDSHDDFPQNDIRGWCAPSALRGQGVERGEKKTSKNENLMKEQERMGSSLPNVLHKEENTTPKRIYRRRSTTDSGKATMPIEEELRELLKSIRDNRGRIACKEEC